MNDDAEELVKIGMEVALRPVTDVAENAIGLLGGDWLSERRRKNRERLRAKTDAELKKAGVHSPAEPSPSIALPLLSGAQDESRDELLDLWAKLLAAACDPKRANTVRREFIDIVKGLEPLDARMLVRLKAGPIQRPEHNAEPKYVWLGRDVGANADETMVSLEHLILLGCIPEGAADAPYLSPLGRELMRSLDDCSGN